jgi:hypothetical protein
LTNLSEVPLSLEHAKKIVTSIQQGELKKQDDPTSLEPIAIRLPPDLDYGFHSHSVYVVHLENNLTVIILPTLYGRIVVKNWIYVSRPPKQDEYVMHKGRLHISLRGREQLPYVRDCLLTKQIEPNWYWSHYQDDFNEP